MSKSSGAVYYNMRASTLLPPFTEHKVKGLWKKAQFPIPLDTGNCGLFKPQLSPLTYKLLAYKLESVHDRTGLPVVMEQATVLPPSDKKNYGVVNIGGGSFHSFSRASKKEGGGSKGEWMLTLAYFYWPTVCLSGYGICSLEGHQMGLTFCHQWKLRATLSSGRFFPHLKNNWMIQPGVIAKNGCSRHIGLTAQLNTELNTSNEEALFVLALQAGCITGLGFAPPPQKNPQQICHLVAMINQTLTQSPGMSTQM